MEKLHVTSSTNQLIHKLISNLWENSIYHFFFPVRCRNLLKQTVIFIKEEIQNSVRYNFSYNIYKVNFYYFSIITNLHTVTKILFEF